MPNGKVEKHTDPGSFGQSLAELALQQARQQSGGHDPTGPVEFQATVTVTPGSWTVTVNFYGYTTGYYWRP
jgi:hypothetical protein